MAPADSRDEARDERRTRRDVAALAAVSAVVYAALALGGDLREHVVPYLVGHAVLAAAGVACWLRVRGAGRAALRLALGSALVFRLVACLGEPALSDDVYRYVWDGRVQIHGIQPFAHAPSAPELEPLRDNGWERINHPEVPTIYPPLAQGLFAGLAALGAGPRGFRLALGLLDFLVVLALCGLAGRIDVPRDRVVLYAWHPLAVMETAGSGHVEPLGVVLVVVGARWIIGGRPRLSTLALAAAIQAKLLPLALLPGWLRRWRGREVLLFLAALAAISAPWALTGPPIGAGAAAYATRWEGNAPVFPFLERAVAATVAPEAVKAAIDAARAGLGDPPFPWEVVYRHVWPGDIARAVAAALGIAWIVFVITRRRLDACRETYLVLAGILLLSPTLHPWYALWVLPFAALYAGRAWLLLGFLLPLSYLGGDGAVPAGIRIAEYAPPAIVAAAGLWRVLRSRRP